MKKILIPILFFLVVPLIYANTCWVPPSTCSGGDACCDVALNVVGPYLYLTGTNNTINFNASAINVTGAATQEEIEDYAGGMFTGNVESGIVSSYVDATGKITLLVNINGTSLRLKDLSASIPWGNLTGVPSGLADGDDNTNAATICVGTTTYLDGDGNCDDISTVYNSSIDLSNYNRSIDLTLYNRSISLANYVLKSDKLGNTTAEIRSQFIASPNVSYNPSTGMFAVNLTCLQITGSAALCDGDDATGAAGGGNTTAEIRSQFVASPNISYDPTTGMFAINLSHSAGAGDITGIATTQGIQGGTDSGGADLQLNLTQMNALGFSRSTMCYQESSNVANSCGGLAGDDYNFTGQSTTPHKAVDTNYSTFGYFGNYTPVIGSKMGGVYINYSLPLGVSHNLTVLQIRYGEDRETSSNNYLVNVSIPLSRWGYQSNKVRFLYNGTEGSSWTRGGLYCYDGSWVRMPLFGEEGPILYEEGIWWSIVSNMPSGFVDTDTVLSEEQVEDYAGGMWTGNTESGITITYQDADGTIDAEVGSLTSAMITDGTIAEADIKAVDTAVDEDVMTYESTTGDFEWHTIGQLFDVLCGVDSRLMYRSGGTWQCLDYSAWDLTASNDLTTATSWSGELAGTGASPTLSSTAIATRINNNSIIRNTNTSWLTANCLAITGSADLCDGDDATGGAGGVPVIGSTKYLYNITTDSYATLYANESALDARYRNSSFYALDSEGYLKNVVEDTTPQLGGSLDANGQQIQMDAATKICLDGSTCNQYVWTDTNGGVVVHYAAGTEFIMNATAAYMTHSGGARLKMNTTGIFMGASGVS